MRHSIVHNGFACCRSSSLLRRSSSSAQSDPSHWSSSLETGFVQAWALLALSVKEDPQSTLRSPTLASVDDAGLPQQRTLVLRGVTGVAEGAPRLRFHTDVRAPKVEQLRRRPALSVLAYDKRLKLQLRIDGTAVIRTLAEGDALAEYAWASSAPISRRCYFIADPPSATSSPPRLDEMASDLRAVRTEDPELASPHFAVIDIEVTSCELLYLKMGGNKRMRASGYSENAPPTLEWLVP
jgi:pyridoxine/pyridoxamine 5'-phosphate oxidase